MHGSRAITTKRKGMGKTMKKILGIILTVIILCVALVACDPFGPDENTIKVTFDPNGGAGTMPDQAIRKDTPTALNANSFTNEGYVFSSWNTDKDGNGKTYQNTEVVTLSDSITLYAQWSIVITHTTKNWEDGKTYTLTENTVIAERVTVTGRVTLILPDDLTLTCKQGITLEDNNILSIRCGERGNGKLIVNGNVPAHYAGIGSTGEKTSGTLIVEGGILDITGGRYAAGIGGGYKGNNGFVIIHGGDVTAVSKKYDDFDYYGGAGIGGGSRGDGGTVIISGGKVSAIAEILGSAIGCGYNGNGGHVSILGGEVNATGCYVILEYEEYWSEGINGYLYLNPGIKLQARIYNYDPWTDYNGEIPRQAYLRTKR